MKHLMRVCTLLTVVVATLAGCADDSGAGQPTPTSATATNPSASATTAANSSTPGTTATDSSAPRTTQQPAETPTTEPSITAPNKPAHNDIEGRGRCVDPESTGVQNALAGLGDRWIAQQTSRSQPGSCAELLWVRAVGGNSAGAPIHLLFFHDGKYLGTATSEAYAFTQVTADSADTVTVEYRWLAGDEPFADPQGGPATITYSWNGSSVVMNGTLPGEVTRPHR
ncbi:LppP/LprE family lipoprotein [Nocardia sp. NPDC127579]|uniref:LppP/LprE family lipoprotein n=1 Tax=Nocardia sp. NPDC127579 TaxID=3345402 RepID=UPI0036407BD8